MQVPLFSACSLFDTYLYPGAKDVNGAHQPSILHRRARLETSFQLPHTAYLIVLANLLKSNPHVAPKKRMLIARTRVYIRVLNLHQSLHIDYEAPAQATAGATRAPFQRPSRDVSFAEGIAASAHKLRAARRRSRGWRPAERCMLVWHSAGRLCLTAHLVRSIIRSLR